MLSTSQTLADSVNVNMKKAIRIISFKKRDAPSLPLFKELNILPLSSSYSLKQGKFMWKLMNGFLPRGISSNFQHHTTNIGIRSRYSVSLARIDCASKHITHAGPLLWQKIPSVIKNVKFFNSFSNKFKQHLINNL